jgi:hypothetical protein
VEKKMVNWENSVADSLFFGKTICQLFYQKIFGRKFHNTSTEFLVLGGACTSFFS